MGTLMLWWGVLLAVLAIAGWAALQRVRGRRRRHGPLRYVQMSKRPLETG